MTMVLRMAEWMASQNVTFRHRVQLHAYSGEEQGLYGSRAWARWAHHNGYKIRAMLQGDMVAYNPTGKLGVAMVQGYTTPSLVQQINQWTAQYVPELEVLTTNACCSDHQSFYEVGYESAGFVEPGGYLIDPEYHHVGDIVYRPGYNLSQIVLIAKAVTVSLCHLAGLLP
jgi:Zn-dependent M28 family amino/carboxypeptidase